MSSLVVGMFVRLVGDQQFYSAGAPVLDDEKEPSVLPPDAKTGLGSSAALVASLVGALFGFFGLITPSSSGAKSVAQSTIKDIAHITAQFAHCDAQGKIGSGFDISAAFYGSQRYTRFSEACLSPVLGVSNTSGCPFILHPSNDLSIFLLA